MNWNQNKSVRLSQVCTAIFMVLLLALDAGCYWLTGAFVRWRQMPWQTGVLLMVSIYTCSVFAWLLLVQLWRLLKNIQLGQVFVEANVRILRIVSWCCVGACVLCLLSALYYFPFAAVGVAAGFMALLVRIIKNVFEMAITMKSELDFTI